MTFYEILEIDKTASNTEIRRAYKYMAKKYHPDKNHSQNTEDKFKDINMAYEVLSDPIKKSNYDSMSESDQLKLYEEFKKMLIQINPNSQHTINKLINFFYTDENLFKNDFNTLNFSNIMHTIQNKLQTVSLSDIDKFIQIVSPNTLTNHVNYINDALYTTFNIDITLDEKYTGGIKSIPYNTNMGNIMLNIPIHKTSVILEYYNLKVNIKTSPHDNFIISNDYDLVMHYDISLYEYFYGTTITFRHLDNTLMEKNIGSLIEDIPFIKFDGKGLLCDDNIERGDLYIYLHVTGINSGSDDFKQRIKFIMFNNFPPLQH